MFKTLPVKFVKKGIKAILMLHGASPNDASITSNILIEGDKCGRHQHGTNRILQILEGVRQKTLVLNARPTLLKNGLSCAVFNANFGLGQAMGHRAMLLAIQKSQVTGIGAVGVINASHIGILS